MNTNTELEVVKTTRTRRTKAEMQDVISEIKFRDMPKPQTKTVDKMKRILSLVSFNTTKGAVDASQLFSYPAQNSEGEFVTVDIRDELHINTKLHQDFLVRHDYLVRNEISKYSPTRKYTEIDAYKLAQLLTKETYDEKIAGILKKKEAIEERKAKTLQKALADAQAFADSLVSTAAPVEPVDAMASIHSLLMKKKYSEADLSDMEAKAEFLAKIEEEAEIQKTKTIVYDEEKMEKLIAMLDENKAVLLETKSILTKLNAVAKTLVVVMETANEKFSG